MRPLRLRATKDTPEMVEKQCSRRAALHSIRTLSSFDGSFRSWMILVPTVSLKLDDLSVVLKKPPFEAVIALMIPALQVIIKQAPRDRSTCTGNICYQVVCRPGNWHMQLVIS